MENRILYLVLLGAVLIGVCFAAPLITNEAEARKFVDKANVQLYAHFNNLSHILDNIDKNNNSEEVFHDFRKIVKTVHALGKIANDTKAYDYSHFKDKELKYIFNILRKAAGESIVGDEQSLRLVVSIAILTTLSSDKDIEGYHDKSLTLAYYPDIQNIIAKSKDTDELIYYWSVWRTKNGGWAKANFANIIEILKNAAKLTGEL